MRRSSSAAAWPDHGIARLELHPLLLAGRHERQRRQRLPLAAGRDDDHARGIDAVEVLDRNDVLVRDREEPELAGRSRRLVHRAPEERDDALVRARRVRHLLDSMDVAREARDDDQLARPRDDLVQHGPDAPLAGGVSGLLGVRRVAQQQVDASTGLRGERVEIRGAPVERRLVDLEVPRVKDRAEGGVHRDRHAVGDGVRHAQEAHRERPHGRRAADDRLAERGALPHAVLLELALEQRERERRPVYRQMPELTKEIRERPDVVLVAVREHGGFEAIGPLAHVGEVRQDEIDARHVGVRERQPGVDQQHAPVELDAGHVPADLTDAAEEHEPRRSRGGGREGRGAAARRRIR
jgi:hypothetical protein